MSTYQIVKMLLNKESEIVSKFHESINEILRLGYDSDRGKDQIPSLISHVEYSLEEIQRIISI